MKKITNRDLQTRYREISADIIDNNETYVVVRYGAPQLIIQGATPPVEKKESQKNPGSKISQKICKHGVIWGVGSCGICSKRQHKDKK